MRANDKNSLTKLYGAKILNEMNLGANADAVSGGLGSPEQVVIGTHTPAEYNVAAKPCCKNCGGCAEENEETHVDHRGCCKKCGHCGGDLSAGSNEDAEAISAGNGEMMRQQENAEETSLPFNTKIDVSIHDLGDNFKRFNDHHIEKTTVNYKIDLEYRSWGLKDITVIPTGEMHITITGVLWTDEARDKEEEMAVVVDASKINTTYDKTHNSKFISSVFINELELYLLPNLQVDYTKSHFVVKC